jgi:hypothetical protein
VCANENASAFAELLGFTSYEQRQHGIASIDALQKTLVKSTA